jgi:hypothetical protein
LTLARLGGHEDVIAALTQAGAAGSSR